jgi:hypothetical protein
MPVSDTLKRAVLGLSSDEVAITLLTFSGDGFTTFRVCDNDTDILSRTLTFTAFPFSIDHPGDREDAPVGTIRISNVDRQIGQAIDAAPGPVNIKIELILASAPDNVEKTFDGLQVRRTRRGSIVIEAELGTDPFATEPWPKIRATPGRLPGLFP